MIYRVRRFEAAPDFLAQASPWLIQNEAENYTNLANPTSNSFCQRLGYTPVADVGDWIVT